MASSNFGKSGRMNEKQSSGGQSRHIRNNFFTSAYFDDNDNIFDGIFDDNDDDDDDARHMKQGNKPLLHQQHNQAASNQTNNKSHPAAPRSDANYVPDTFGSSFISRDTRDSTAARYQLLPEEVQRTNRAIPRNVPQSSQVESKSTQPSATAKSGVTTTSATANATGSLNATLRPLPFVEVPETSPVKSFCPTATLQASTTATGNRKTSAPAKSDSLAPTPAAPYGYKIIKVKKPDGTIIKVKRPLKEGEKPPMHIARKPLPASVQNITQPPTQRVPSMSVTATSGAPVTNCGASHAQSPNTTGIVSTTNVMEAIPTSGKQPALTNGSTSTNTKLPSTYEKYSHGVQVAENDPEQATTTQPAARMNHDGFKRFARVDKLLIWGACILFPLLFLILGIVTACRDRKPLPKGWCIDPDVVDPLYQATTVAASVWPIVFAAVVAQSLKMYAAYRIEQGIKLVTLEQLISSHSVGGTIKQPFALHTFNWTTVILLFIWCLSPLAGQAILRMSWFDCSTDSMPSKDESTILNALIYGYNQTSQYTQDIYNNLRIPVVAEDTATSDDEGSQYSTDIKYSSLLGYPYWISGLGINDTEDVNHGQETNFTINTTYFALNCTEPELVSADSVIMLILGLNYDSSKKRTMCVSAENNTDVAINDTATNNTVIRRQPGQTGYLYFSSNHLHDDALNGSDPRVWFSNCSYDSIMVATSFECHDVEQYSICWALSSHRLHVPEYDLPPLGYYFPQALQNLSVMSSDNDFSQAEKFIMDPFWASHQNGDKDGNFPHSLGDVTAAQLSDRLGLVVNTLWAAGLNRSAFVGPDQYTWNNIIPIENTSANVTGTRHEFHVVRWPWLGVLIASSSLLTVAGIAAMIWEKRIVGPDFLGFANTVVKKSVKMPKSMSTMDARDRLHTLQECEVLLQDDRPNDAVGRIVLGIKEEESTRLVRGRDYR